MSLPSKRRPLSATSIAWLSALAGFNLAMVLYFSLWREADIVEPAPETTSVEASELRLLRELSVTERQALGRQPPPPVPRALPQPIMEPVTVCRSWGPFADAAVLEQVRAELEEVGEILEERPTQVRSTPDYLVRLEADNNLDNARRLLKELESQSIDAYVIAGGEFVNSVSAGVFSHRGSGGSTDEPAHRSRLPTAQGGVGAGSDRSLPDGHGAG